MKRFLVIILCFATLLCCMNLTAFAEGEQIVPRYNNVNTLNSAFTIDADGTAKVTIGYIGYAGTTENVKITTTLQKRSLLVFWNDVTEWVDRSSSSRYDFSHTYHVEEGTYRVKIRFEFSGSGGATDVIEKEHKASR